MNRNFRHALAMVLRHEGGYVHHPKDPGGATNKGITLGTYRQYVNPNGTAADLKRITDAEVAKVYKEHYWDAVSGDALPDGVDYAVFDYAVNSGPSRGIRALQRAVDVIADGKIGPATMIAVMRHDPAQLINEICDGRLRFLKGLDTWVDFGKGWSRRVADVRKHALAMLENVPAKPVDVAKPDIKPKPVVKDSLTPEKAPRRSIWAALFDIFLKLFNRR
jgi:lysozyme family protein